MKRIALLLFCLAAYRAAAFEFDDLLDQVDGALTFSSVDHEFRMRISGTLDTEFYHFEQPAPGLIDANHENLFNPRLSLFLDGQFGPQLYFFAQSRIDRGFDPSDHGGQIRLDECAARFTPWNDGRFNIQVGKFATVIGNWVPRHLSWENPFVTAPLIYENTTAVSDKTAPKSPADLVLGFDPTEKFEYNPVIWGPVYGSGVAVSGRVESFDYALEMKNAPPASRPSSWTVTANGFDQPAFDGRIGFRPSELWNFGLSGSEGAYFRSEAERTLPRGRDLDDYREFLIGQDASFAWHHLQLWAEFYEARFEVPRVGDVDTFAYYFEAKYKFAPQFFGAVRWNQQLFDKIEIGPGDSQPWSPDIWRIDLAGGYRLTPHAQLKLQYSFQQETSRPRNDNHLFAAQFTVRF